MMYSYLIISLLAVTSTVRSEDLSILNKCSRKVEPVGCYKDVYGSRALPYEILNGRDETSKVFNNNPIDWNLYHAYLQNFICKCAELAFKKGYKVIGIQFYGECWAGPEGHLTFAKHGKSDLCLTQDMSKPRAEQYRKCRSDTVCTGEQLTNYVYRIAPTACDVYYEPIGCFKDDLVKPRPFPQYIMNERDYSVANWNGKLIDWSNWNTYSPKMICRCAEKAKSKGMKHFGIQFYGECWAGEEDESKIKRAGLAGSDQCMAQNFKACPYNSFRCVGKAKVFGAYRIIAGPTKENLDIAYDNGNELKENNDVSDENYRRADRDRKKHFHRFSDMRKRDDEYDIKIPFDEEINDIIEDE